MNVTDLFPKPLNDDVFTFSRHVLKMAEEPTLPRLPGPSSATPALFTKGRKRARMAFGSASMLSTSSDPAVFSSDDDPALDNYIHGVRRKKRYVGSWFDQQPASSDSAVGDEPRRPMPKSQPQQQRQRQLRRQLDSGVWMGQDDSTDIDEYSELELRPSKVFTPSKLSSPTVSSRFTIQERHAQNCIHKCIEEGKEEVDLKYVSPFQPPWNLNTNLSLVKWHWRQSLIRSWNLLTKLRPYQLSPRM